MYLSGKQNKKRAYNSRRRKAHQKRSQCYFGGGTDVDR